MKASFRKYKGLTPLILLTGLCLYNFAIAFYPILDTNTYAILNSKHYFAGLAVIINFVLFFSYKEIYKYSVFMTLILGTFGIINFMRSEFSINIGSLSIGFHIIPLIIGLFTMILYSERFKKNQVSASGIQFENMNIDNAGPSKEEIEKFKSKFRDRPSETLTELCSDNRYSFSAKEAAKELLAERLKLDLHSQDNI